MIYLEPFRGPAPIVTVLCGSTRFVETFNEHRKLLTEAGHIVLSIEVVTTQAREDDPQFADPALKARLDELHKRKIDIANDVLVLNVGGYIGESTRGEIEYAALLGKPIRYLESVLERPAANPPAAGTQSVTWEDDVEEAIAAAMTGSWSSLTARTLAAEVRRLQGMAH